MWNKIKNLKIEIKAWYLIFKSPYTPLLPKILIILAAFYVISPIDIIPDFVPGLGQLDDFVLVWLLVSIAFKLIPKHIVEDCRRISKFK